MGLPAAAVEQLRVVEGLRPVDFVQSDEEQATLFRRVAQALFSWAKEQEEKPLGPLDELLVDGFDEEGVWQQLQLRNKPLLRFVDREIRKEGKVDASAELTEHENGHAARSKETLTDTVEEEDAEEEEESGEEGGEEDEEDEGEEEEAEDEGEEGSEEEGDSKGSEEGSEEGGKEEASAERARRRGAEPATAAQKKKATRARGVPRDLEQMAREMDEFAEEAEGENADEEGMDELYGGAGGDDEEEEEEGEEEEEEEEEEEGEEEDEEDSEGELGEEEGLEVEQGAGGERKGLSEHERRQMRLREKLSKMEEAQVAEKPWQLTGEVSAKQRPVNSLLDTVLDFEAATKAAPQMTEEESRSVEEIIKARIKDELWDDPIRKAALETRKFRPKAAELSQEKSSIGLAEQYEKDYAEQVLGHRKPDEVSEAHKAVDATFDKLSAKLDALFAFHFTPRKPKAEVTIRSAMPAVQLEEAIPTAVANSSTLAPEEVYGVKKGVKLADRSEMTQEERKAYRRKKKRVHARRTAEKLEQTKLRATLQPGGAAAKKLDDDKVSRDLADAKRKGKIGTGELTPANTRGGSDFSKSAKFFKQLQEGGKASMGGRKRAAPTDDDGRRGMRVKL